MDTTDRPATANILEVVRTLRPELRKSDRKVADAVLADPARVLKATVAEMALLAEVSQPTVIRFCVAIGCSGYQEFRLRLAHSLALGLPATHSVLLGTDTPATVVDKIFDYTLSSLDWARNHLDKAAVEAAVAILEQARSIAFFGFGASGIVARDAQQKFPLFGVPCSAELDSHQQIMAASMMQPGDVAVVISNTGRTRSIIEVARTARENGAKVICLTGTDSPLVPVQRRGAGGRDAGEHQRLHPDDLAHRRAGGDRYSLDRRGPAPQRRPFPTLPDHEAPAERAAVQRKAVTRPGLPSSSW